MGKLDELARQRIAGWIKGSGTTQVAVGEKIGRNQAWMSRYLDGEFDADFDTVAQLAAVFDHTLFEVFDVSENEAEQALLADYRALRPEARQLARQVLRDWSGAARRGRTRKQSGPPARERAHSGTESARKG